MHTISLSHTTIMPIPIPHQSSKSCVLSLFKTHLVISTLHNPVFQERQMLVLNSLVPNLLQNWFRMNKNIKKNFDSIYLSFYWMDFQSDKSSKLGKKSRICCECFLPVSKQKLCAFWHKIDSLFYTVSWNFSCF